eukprot:CAMPEP_0118940580 /NCGR_PEP_ID=MMETSP1169-20130426/31807_1 /TAXON_ID=36882 /ORGANISM="Pyramimonas obovata, Strain CCMP722" /LENGTH=89 /DNA_ID=CAMNT_0006885113 /DNA_START=111 /DNA_END=380 /DNA_ORIENTATION=-
MITAIIDDRHQLFDQWTSSSQTPETALHPGIAATQKGVSPLLADIFIQPPRGYGHASSADADYNRQAALRLAFLISLWPYEHGRRDGVS